jgi:hypothetical protein
MRALTRLSGKDATSTGLATEQQERRREATLTDLLEARRSFTAGGFQGASTAFSPASNARDRDATSRFMRERTKDELAQIIAAPIKLVDSLPGFTRDHLHTSHQDIAIRLAKAEAWRWVDRQSGKGFPVLVLVACLGVAVSAAVGLLTQVSPADILDHLRTTARAWLP